MNKSGVKSLGSRFFVASARKKRIGFCLNENRKGVSLKSPPIAGKGGIAGIVIIDTIDTIGTINTIGTIISPSLR